MGKNKPLCLWIYLTISFLTSSRGGHRGGSHIALDARDNQHSVQRRAPTASLLQVFKVVASKQSGKTTSPEFLHSIYRHKIRKNELNALRLFNECYKWFFNYFYFLFFLILYIFRMIPEVRKLGINICCCSLWIGFTAGHLSPHIRWGLICQGHLNFSSLASQGLKWPLKLQNIWSLSHENNSDSVWDENNWLMWTTPYSSETNCLCICPAPHTMGVNTSHSPSEMW